MECRDTRASKAANMLLHSLQGQCAPPWLAPTALAPACPALAHPP